MDTDIDKFKNQKIVMSTNNNDVIELASNNLANHINEIGTSESTQVNSKRLRQFIIKNIVQPVYVSDLRDTLIWRYRWRKIANCLYIFSKLLTLSGAVLAFCETYFRVTYLSLSAGIVTLLSVLILQLGDFAHKESKKKTFEANEILRSLNITGVPEIDDDIKKNHSDINHNVNNIDQNPTNTIDQNSNNIDQDPNNINQSPNNIKKTKMNEDEIRIDIE